MKKNNDGIALVALIVIVLITSIVSLGIATCITQGAAYNNRFVMQLQSLAAAEAGISSALANHLWRGYWSKVTTDTVVSGGASYKVGRDENFLLVNAVGAMIGSSAVSWVYNFDISNVNGTGSLTIAGLIVDLKDVAGVPIFSNVTGIMLGGVSRWSGSVQTGNTITPLMPTCNINNRSTMSNNQITFSSILPSNCTITTTFILSGDTADNPIRRKAIIINKGMGANKEFSVSATGKAGPYKRSIEITYDTDWREITSWQENYRHL